MLVGVAVIVLSLGLALLIAVVVLRLGLRLAFHRARTLVRRLAERRAGDRPEPVVSRRQEAERRI